MNRENKKANHPNSIRGTQRFTKPSQINGDANIVINNETAIPKLRKLAQDYVGVTNPYGFLTNLRNALEIPNLEGQTRYFHGGKSDAIVIEKNHFITFDKPLLYAKSVDGLIFRKNKVTRNQDYKAFHWNQEEILLEKCNHIRIED